MKKQWLVALGILGVFLFITVITGGSAEAAVTTCADNGGTKHIVDTAAEATDIGANGYDNSACNLEILISITPIPVETLEMKAKSIKVQGPGVEIINSTAASDVKLTATNGDIIINEASIKARDLLQIMCNAPAACKIDVDNSEIIASLTLDAVFPPPGTGSLSIVAQGDVELTNSTIFGAQLLRVISNNGMITFICPGAGGCRDPLTSNKAVELCGVPPGTPPAVFPCTVTFNTAQELKEVCFPGVTCGGGGKQIDIRAKLDIVLTGSTIIGDDHVSVVSKDGSLLAQNANLTADSWRITVKGTVDIKGATITAVGLIRIESTACAGAVIPGPPFCVDAENATLDAANTSPTLNCIVVGVPAVAPNGRNTIVCDGGAGELNLQGATLQ